MQYRIECCNHHLLLKYRFRVFFLFPHKVNNAIQELMYLLLWFINVKSISGLGLKSQSMGCGSSNAQVSALNESGEGNVEENMEAASEEAKSGSSNYRKILDFLCVYFYERYTIFYLRELDQN